jgi:hypothetical protein
MTRGNGREGGRTVWAALRSPSRPVRLALTFAGAVTFAAVTGVLLHRTLLETVGLTIAVLVVIAISKATEQRMERLQARSGLLHGAVLFVSGVAATLLLFVASGERPSPWALYAGFLVALSGRKRRPRKPDEDWIGSTSSTSRDDGRRWRTGSP